MNSRLANKLKKGLTEAIEFEKGNLNLRTTKRQWCNDIDAQKIIENREETIKFLTDQARQMKKEIIQLKIELENAAPVIQRQQAYIVKANELLTKHKIQI